MERHRLYSSARIYAFCLTVDSLPIITSAPTKNTLSNHYLKRELENLDLIFLSRADRCYSGALSFVVANFNFKGSIYSTIPVKYLSSLAHKTFMLNHLSKHLVTKEQSSEYFGESFKIYDMIIDLKFRQKENIKGTRID